VRRDQTRLVLHICLQFVQNARLGALGVHVSDDGTMTCDGSTDACPVDFLGRKEENGYV
jgi:hypothetical protein